MRRRAYKPIQPRLSLEMPKIVQHQRLPYDGQVSIERLFEEIRNHLPEECSVKVATSPLPSKGLWPRVKNVFYARRQQAAVHHIIGDVHYLAFGLPPQRTVLTIHDCATLKRLKSWKRAIFRYFWFTGPMRRAAVVTTISGTTKNELHQWVGSLADKVVVIPNCVRSEFTPNSKPFNQEAPIVLQVGTGWNKNVERVAQALHGTGCQLEIVGKLTTAQRSALEASGVTFRELGKLSDVLLVAAYQRCDILIFASLYEGFGLPILEAQAVGRPVITSNLSSMPEAAGAGALFVDPLNVQDIHSAVQRLLHEPLLREELVRRGLDNVAKYRPEAIARHYAQIYRMLPSEIHT